MNQSDAHTYVVVRANKSEVLTRLEHFMYFYQIDKDFRSHDAIRVTASVSETDTELDIVPDKLNAMETVALAHALGISLEQVVSMDNSATFFSSLDDSLSWIKVLDVPKPGGQALRAFRALKEWPVTHQMPCQ
jgi:hypothetical protein